MYVPGGEAQGPERGRRRVWGILISLVALAVGLAIVGLAVDQTVRALTGRGILALVRVSDRPFDGCSEGVPFSDDILLLEPPVIRERHSAVRTGERTSRPRRIRPAAPPVTLLDTAPGRALIQHATPEKGAVLKWFGPRKYVLESWFVESVDHRHGRVVLTHSGERRSVVLEADPGWASGAGPRVTLEGVVHEDRIRLRIQTAEGEHVAHCGPGDIVWGSYRVLKTERSPTRAVLFHEASGRELSLEFNELALMP